MRYLLKLSLALAIFPCLTFAQVGIGTTTPNTQSALDITDTTKGILIPRLTEQQKFSINSPPEGLMIYQTDKRQGFYYYGKNYSNQQYLMSPGWQRMASESTDTMFGTLTLPTGRVDSNLAINFKGFEHSGIYFDRFSGLGLTIMGNGQPCVAFNIDKDKQVSYLRSFGVNRFFLVSEGAIVQLSRYGRYEFESFASSDMNFVGYQGSTSQGKTIVFTTDFQPSTAVCPIAVKGVSTVNLQEWRNFQDTTLTHIDYQGNINLSTSTIIVDEASINAASGEVQLTNGSVFVSNTSIDNKSRIFVSNNNEIGNPGYLTVSKNNGVGFTINSSSNTDNSSIAYFIIKAK